MTDGMDKLCEAGARLLNSVAAALDGYTKLQEKRAEYFDNAAKQFQDPQARPFDEFQPGYFEKLAEAQRRA